MSKLRNRRQKLYHERTQHPGGIAFDINEWLKESGRLVTRKELWEFTTRLEIGKRMRNRWSARLRRLGRRIWSALTRQHIEVEDPIYRPGFPTKEAAWKRTTPADASASSPAASSPPGSPTPSDMRSSPPSGRPSPAASATPSGS